MNAAIRGLAAALLWASGRAAASDAGEAAVPAGEAGSAAGTLRAASDAAWWTGSLLSASAETLAVGHWLVEPYVLDQTVDGRFDAQGRRQDAPSIEREWSAAYLMYGLAEGVSIGAHPRALLGAQAPGTRLSGPTAGDVTALLQLRLAPRHPPGPWPAVSLVLGETFPTGRYDRLSGGPDAASGAGVHRTDVSLYAQSLVPAGGRPLRLRLNLTYGWSDSTGVTGASVYGTPAGFQGRAHPRSAASADAAFEFSLSSRWVLALDVLYQRDDGFVAAGTVAAPAGVASPLRIDAGPGASWSVAPAVECNFSASVGLIVGIKLTAAGRDAPIERVPAAALNLFF